MSDRETERLDYGRPTPGRFSGPAWKRARIGSLVAVGVVSALLAGGLFYAVLMARHVDKNMEKARNHIPVIRAILGNDPRFDGITFSDFTARNGSLLIDGVVDTAADLDELKARVESTHVPVPVMMNVGVRTRLAQTQPSTRPTAR